MCGWENLPMVQVVVIDELFARLAGGEGRGWLPSPPSFCQYYVNDEKERDPAGKLNVTCFFFVSEWTL
jgi:hypothetical protein